MIKISENCFSINCPPIWMWSHGLCVRLHMRACIAFRNINFTCSSAAMTDESTHSTTTERTSPTTQHNVYSFESDSLAFRGNKDYQRLLGTIVTLESQRVQALHDIETLLTCQQEALADPIQFVHRLQQDGDLGFPTRQKVAELPAIAWQNYASNLDAVSWTRKHATRNQNKTDGRLET